MAFRHIKKEIEVSVMVQEIGKIVIEKEMEKLSCLCFTNNQNLCFVKQDNRTVKMKENKKPIHQSIQPADPINLDRPNQILGSIFLRLNFFHNRHPGSYLAKGSKTLAIGIAGAGIV